ncbi:MAG: GAF and ANTAR domain-containing protein [Acidimicrobiia bacterium]
MATAGSSEELTEGFVQITRLLASTAGVTDTLRRIVDLAVATVDGCDMAGISLLEGAEVTSPAQSDPVVAEVDAAQHETREGPCLDAIAKRACVYAEDLERDPRWPVFGPRAAASGLRSLLSCPLLGDGTLGALNLYSRFPDAFGATARGVAMLFGAQAGVALVGAQTRAGEAQRAEHLETALASREVIGQAQGILMERERITSDAAFDLLRQASNHLNEKLRDVAGRLVETGEWPPGSAAPPSGG